MVQDCVALAWLVAVEIAIATRFGWGAAVLTLAAVAVVLSLQVQP